MMNRPEATMMAIPSHFDAVGKSANSRYPSTVAEMISKYWNGARSDSGAMRKARTTRR
ncbi:hypothetical protein D3C80_2195290 [compost metagenome]